MRLLRGRNALTQPPRRAVVTIGMFDGVHLGHQRLIRTTVRLAKRLRGTSVVITFDPDPQRVLNPAQAQPRLMPLDARLGFIGALGADLAWVIPFTRRFSRVDAEQFFREILLKQAGAVAVVVGENFSFGRNRRGNLALLRAYGRRDGMRIVVTPPVVREHEVVSSSRLRRTVQRGEIASARRLLGRPAQLYGTVVRGEGRARQLGFPTANVRLVHGLVQPPHGVYRVWLALAGRRYQGLMNLGIRPTFLSRRAASRRNGPIPVVCEVHLPGFRGNLYGQSVTIALLAWVRPERRFAGPEALAQQIRQDLRRTHLLPARR
ncbi:MAG: riboflavin biosynthesis protein RibF [Candidatus Omnitrophica bacterium]|nr:riboflavin biosynthesis protein RibF [Candidatus Omnitrophota bacterium]